MRVAAGVGAVLLGVVAVFQIVLALGAPYGRAAWGGQHEGTVPTSLRVASGVAGVVVYPAAIAVVLAGGGLIGSAWLPGTGAAVLWVLAALFALGAVANLVSRSRVERRWAPVSLAIAVCCAVIAAGL